VKIKIESHLSCLFLVFLFNCGFKDIEQFPGHIACNSKTKSEIVIPVKDNYDKLVGVLDVDSIDHNSFDNYDKEWLEKIVKLIYQ
jgi:GAF domain-containing protein